MMSDLTVFLYQRAFHQNCTSEKRKAICTEACEYIDKIIAGCNDINIRVEAVELACNIFPTVGRYDDAVKLISDIPSVSKDEMLLALYSGQKLIELTKDIICKTVSSAADRIIMLASMTDDEGTPVYDVRTQITLYEKAISLYKTLYETQDYFFDAESLAEAEKRIAHIFALRRDTDNVLKHLGECVKYVVQFDTYDETKDTYTSTIPYGRSPVGINRNNKHNTSHEMLMRLNNDTDYDFIRDDNEFKHLIEKLRRTDNLK